MHLGDDMVEALGAFFQAAEAVEAGVALTGKDGVAQRRCGEKIEFIDCGRGGAQGR